MPCLGSRKKTKTSSQGSTQRSASITSSHSATQIKQEYQELKAKNIENLDVIAKQKSELEKLKSQINARKTQDVESQHKETLAELKTKEAELEKNKQELEELKKTLDSLQQENKAAHLLVEKDKLIKKKEEEIEALQTQYEEERAELVKPALAQVTSQLDELKETNKIVMERLSEKENELVELRSQLNRRDRKPKLGVPNDDNQKKLLNRLTMDLENDRMLAHKLEELNHQLKTQKQKHENILESHAKALAEKDKSLENLKKNHESSVTSLEQKQIQNLNKLQLKYEKDVSNLNTKLHRAETQAKTTVDDEVFKILNEFESYEHSHSVEVAHLQKSHHEQISVIKKSQQSEIQQLNENKIVAVKLRKTGGSSSKFKWPAPDASQSTDLSPRDPKEIHLYTSSISNSIKLKKQEEDIIKSLESENVQFKVIDVAKSELALQHMRKNNTRARALPQIFMGGLYKCTYDEFEKAKNNGNILQLLNSSGEEFTKFDIHQNRITSHLPTPVSTPPI